MAAENARIPASLRNELRRTIAVKIFNYINTLGDMKKAQQEGILLDLFHGDDDRDIVSHLDLLLQGEAPYRRLYDISETTVITDANHRGPAPTRMVLKPKFTRTEAKTYAVGEEIVKPSLRKTSFNSEALVTGRTLLNAAKEALKNMKKLTAFALKNGVNPDDPLSFPSGLSEEDMDVLILRDFHRFTNGKVSIEENPESVAQDDEEEEQQQGDPNNSDTPPAAGAPVLSAGWYPNGWFAFKLFGLMAPPDDRLDLLQLGDNLFSSGGKKKAGRAALRKAQAAEANKERSLGAGPGGRGLTLRDRVALSSLILQEDAQEAAKKERRMIGLRLQLDQLSKMIDRADKRGDDDRVEELESQEGKLTRELGRLTAPTPPGAAGAKKRSRILDMDILPRKRLQDDFATVEQSPPSGVEETPNNM